MAVNNVFNTNTIAYQLRRGTAITQNNEVWAENIFLCRIPFMEFCFKWSWRYFSYWFQWIQCILKYMERSGYFSICDNRLLTTSSTLSGFSFGVCRVLDILIFFIESWHVFFCLITVYLVIALCIFAPYNRILTVALKGHHYIFFSLHYINLDLREKNTILHAYIIIYACIHNYLCMYT